MIKIMSPVNCFLLRVALISPLAACSATPAAPDAATLQEQVKVTERAFAAAMAERNFSAFTSFISDEAVFLAEGRTLHGKAAVSKEWKQFFEKAEAPFSWTPERVEVLPSGQLAISTGPVLDGKGHRVATFTSIWRLEAHGRWRIVFDKGEHYCDSGSGP